MAACTGYHVGWLHFRYDLCLRCSHTGQRACIVTSSVIAIATEIDHYSWEALL